MRMGNHVFYNKLVVITGTFDKYTYEELKNIFICFGAGVQAEVNRKTDYVIVGVNPSFTTMELSNSYNKKILYEDELVVWFYG